MELYLGRCVAWRHTFFIIDVIAVLTDSPNPIFIYFSFFEIKLGYAAMNNLFFEHLVFV